MLNYEPLTFGSVASGIEAASVAWEPLGWRAAWFSEIEPFPCRLLKYHYPSVPNLGDMLYLTENKTFNESIIDVLVGGTPCQSFSLAGLRGGLADSRGNLSLQYCKLLIAKRPKWFVWENVPGVFSSFSNDSDGPDLERIGRENGRNIVETSDFATLLTAFSECGYSVAYRVLDSQFFGVPQRRRRVFIVGHIGDDWRPPAAVLLEPASLRGNIEETGKTREEIAGSLTASAARSRGSGIDPGILVANSLDTRPRGDQNYRRNLVPCWWDGGQTSQTLDAVLAKGQTMPDKNRFPAVLVPAVGFNTKTVVKPGNRSLFGDVMPAISTDAGAAFASPTVVRRLTPLECERLQGFPDNYTNIPKAKDAPRYKALGNSMTVDVMRWIGRRIQKVDHILNKNFSK